MQIARVARDQAPPGERSAGEPDPEGVKLKRQVLTDIDSGPTLSGLDLQLSCYRGLRSACLRSAHGYSYLSPLGIEVSQDS